ncbi:MAG: tetratricopeptide repeat protein [Deltaproteobacteria bacterium]|nr:tetratricopeptide repeat protein [Deltaproteobacteria bacterium]
MSMFQRLLSRSASDPRVVVAAVVFGSVTIGCEPPMPPLSPPVLVAEPPASFDGRTPGQGTTDLDRGVALVQNERYAEGARLIERAMTSGLGDGESTYYLAFAYERMGNRKEAESYYLKTLQLDPQLVNARVNLAAMYLEEPLQPAKAITVLEPAVATEPKSADIRLNLAYAYRLEKNLPKAAEHYRASLAIEDKVETRQMLVDVLFDAGDTKEVVGEMKTLLPAFAKDAKAMAAFGGRFAKVRAYADCAAAFTKALELQPKNAGYHVNRGLCRHEVGDAEAEVAKDYEAAVDLEPKNQAAWYYLGMSQLLAEERSRGIEALEKAIRLGADTAFGKKAKEKWSAVVKKR